jgi:hypothetical protein
MALRVAKVKEVTWPVRISIPQDGGKVQNQDFDAKFEIISQAEHDDVLKGGGDMLARVWTGAQRLVGEDGKSPVEFSEEIKAELLDVSYFRTGLASAYYEAFYGRKAERKNG